MSATYPYENIRETPEERERDMNETKTSSDPTRPSKRWPGKRQEMRDFNRGTVFWASMRLGTYVHGMVKKNMNRTYGVSRAK